MAELTALLESGADVGKIASAQPVATASYSAATAVDEDPAVKPGRRRKGMTNDPTIESQKAAGAGSPLNKLNGSDLKDDDALQQFDEVTLAASKAAREYRSWMLEQIKININTGLEYANRLTGATLLPDADKTADQLSAQGKSPSAPKPESQLPASAKAVEEYRIKAFELMTANANATLEYAQQLANVRSPAEFVELSTNHARKHLELIMTHAAALGAVSQSLMTVVGQRSQRPIATGKTSNSG